MNRIKIFIVVIFAIAGVTVLFTNNVANRTAHAFSSGPPAGYTRAPGEEPEACAECHVNSDPGTGHLTINAPQSYVPGQAYQITVSHANADQTRIRWGFELTALNDSDEKAGTLEILDNTTRIREGQGPFPARQYIEHTSIGTFLGQHNGASWTFKWTAPSIDVGPVTFYVAGNEANGDGNSSGDNIYTTFATAISLIPSTVEFSAAAGSVAESGGLAQITVNRIGDTGSPATVDYSTSDGTASERTDYTTARGTLRFAAGETSKTFNVLVTEDAFVEGNETINLTLSNATGATAPGTQSSEVLTITDNNSTPSTSNPIDNSTAFVRQHYHDFLNREADVSGLNFWTSQIESCGTDATCREVKRINVSAAFFLSIEFQQTGYLVYRLHQTAFNTGETLKFNTFLADTQEIGRGVVVGATNWEQQLEANKVAFTDAFVQRAQFTAAYPLTMTAAQFVDALNSNTRDPLNPASGGALTQTERNQLVTDLSSNMKTRAQVLRAISENAELQRRQFNRAFVLMQYFGYLRRNPNDVPDTDFGGYNFWLGKLNQFNGNYIQAEMVKAFLAASEYRKRFGTQ